MTPRTARIRARRHQSKQVFTLDIEVEDGEPSAFAPGQFNMLTAFGVGEIPISVSGDRDSPRLIAHTVRAVGPVSSALCSLKTGDVLGLRGPFGTGWPMAELEGRDVVVVAGGLGLAPLRPVLVRLLRERKRHGGVTVLYGTRSPDDILYRSELEKWRRSLDTEIEVTVDHAAPDWRGHVGVVTTLISRGRFDPRRTIALVCGPEIMMRFAIAALHTSGMPAEAIYLSMERNMKCAIGLCGHCQFGPHFICRDGPVFRYDRVSGLIGLKEI